MITPNYDETISFLESYRPMGSGTWLLMAIRVDKKEWNVCPFSPAETKEARGWLEKYGAENKDPEHAFNLYFHVNPTIRMMAKKAEKESIKAMEYLHIDLDPRPGEELQAEKDIFIRALTENLPKGVGKPTFIVDSGAGYHAYWKLDVPFSIEGDAGKFNEAERYNIQLVHEFGGDKCYNVDRILRLPGTINRPDKNKRAKGRTTYLCTLVEHNDVEYSLTDFTPAPLVQTGGGFADHLSMVDIKGTVDFFDDIDKLDEWNVPLHTKIVIVQGIDPDEPNRWESRSEPLHYVTNSMTRCGVPDEYILSVLENPAFKISESIIEKGNGARKYALKQINGAKETAISPKLQELNAKHAVVRSVGGSCRIISEEWDEEMKRLSLDYQTATDFNTYYMNQKMEMEVQGKDGDTKLVSVPLGKWWMTHPNRRSYERVVFAPGAEVTGSYNLWTGFGCEARPGACDLYLEHLKANICSGNEEHFTYLMGWMASAVQNPGEQGHTAIVLQGSRGAGKGVFASEFGELFGRHFLAVTHGDHLVGKFNNHLRDCVLLYGDEAFYAGDKKHEGMLKVLITERTLMTEKKGVDAAAGRNYTHVILASNDDWVVPAGENERRFFIMRVGDDKMQDTAYFTAILDQMERGGREALLHFLMHYDLSDFKVRDVPKTSALQAQKAHTFKPTEEWWYSKLQDGEIEDGAGWPSAIPRANMRENIVAYFKAFGMRGSTNATSFGRFMSRALPGDLKQVRLSGTHTIIGEDGEPRPVDRPRGYILPSLEECRLHWEKIFGGKFEWNEAYGQTAESSLGLNEEAF